MDSPKQGNSGEDYSKLLWIGLIMALVLLLGVSYYWLSDTNRLAKAAEFLLADRIERGEEMYAEQCIACHGAEGEGGSGPVLNDRSLLKKTQDEVFYSLIRSGVPNTQMPAWSVEFGGPLTDEDIRDMVAFIRAWEPDAPEIIAQEYTGDPAQGAALFDSTCAVCHGEAGQGGREGIPAINNPERLAQFDLPWYRDVIANGRPAKGMPTWGTVLSPEQMADLTALIAAWQEGYEIAPGFSDTDLLENAEFALSQGDGGSAQLHLGRALAIMDPAGAEVVENVLDLVEAGDLDAAQASLQELVKLWPVGDPAAGVLIYSAECAMCHGPQGLGGIGTALQDNVFIQTSSNAELVAFVQEGRPGTNMVGFDGRLTEAESADVVAFLRLWQ